MANRQTQPNQNQTLFALGLMLVLAGTTLLAVSQAQAQRSIIPSPACQRSGGFSGGLSCDNKLGTASIDGRVTLFDNPTIGLDKATIALVTSQDKLVDLVDTDDNGHFHVDNLTPGKQIVNADRDSFSDEDRIITLTSGKTTTINFELKPALSNQAYGYVVSPQGKPLEGVLVVVYRSGRLLESDATDQDGYYDISDLPRGDSTLAIMSNADQDHPTFYTGTSRTITFSVDYGQTRRNNYRLRLPPPGRTKLLIKTFRDFATKNFDLDNEEIRNVNLDVSQSVQQGQQKRWQSIGKYVSPKEIVVKPGNYSVSGKQIGYNDNEKPIYISGAHPFDLLLLDLKPTNTTNECLKLPESDFHNVWYCGLTALHDIGKFEPLVENPIVKTILGLRQKYSMPNLPANIVVVSSSEFNAEFSSAHQSLPNCQEITSNPLFDQSYIEISTNLLEITSPTEIEHIITHEFGHARDWYLGGCSPNKWSSQGPAFEQLRLAGQKFGDLYFINLKDSVFDFGEPRAGHPNENETETYASAFHIGELHYNEFVNSMTQQELPPLLIKILRQTVDYTQQKKP